METEITTTAAGHHLSYRADWDKPGSPIHGAEGLTVTASVAEPWRSIRLAALQYLKHQRPELTPDQRDQHARIAMFAARWPIR